MIWIVLLRAVIWATFLLLVVAVVAGIIWTRWFYKHYVKAHRELVVRVEANERHIKMLEDRPL